MKESTKAALLSAFVFPGAGHLYLKRYFPGAVLFSVSLGAIYFIVSKMVDRAFQLVEKIQNGTVELNAANIMQLVSQQAAENKGNLLGTVSAIFIICWLLGIIDSYRVGRVPEN